MKPIIVSRDPDNIQIIIQYWDGEEVYSTSAKMNRKTVESLREHHGLCPQRELIEGLVQAFEMVDWCSSK